MVASILLIPACLYVATYKFIERQHGHNTTDAGGDDFASHF